MKIKLQVQIKTMNEKQIVKCEKKLNYHVHGETINCREKKIVFGKLTVRGMKPGPRYMKIQHTVVH